MIGKKELWGMGGVLIGTVLGASLKFLFDRRLKVFSDRKANAEKVYDALLGFRHDLYDPEGIQYSEYAPEVRERVKAAITKFESSRIQISKLDRRLRLQIDLWTFSFLVIQSHLIELKNAGYSDWIRFRESEHFGIVNAERKRLAKQALDFADQIRSHYHM